VLGIMAKRAFSRSRSAVSSSTMVLELVPIRFAARRNRTQRPEVDQRRLPHLKAVRLGHRHIPPFGSTSHIWHHVDTDVDVPTAPPSRAVKLLYISALAALAGAAIGGLTSSARWRSSRRTTPWSTSRMTGINVSSGHGVFMTRARAT
jgi:hypothetical protein